MRIEVHQTKETKLHFPVVLLSQTVKTLSAEGTFNCPHCHGRVKSEFPGITMCKFCRRLVDGGKLL